MVVCVTATTDHLEIAVPGVAQAMSDLQQQASQPSRLIASVWLVPLLAGAWLLGERPLQAQVSAASGAQSLGTIVNGVMGGSCSSGPCTVSGGIEAGTNLFHRMSAFDTRGAITGVQFANGGQSNVIVGVTSPFGTHIDKLVSLSNPGNLLFLSPGGLSLSGAAGFIQTNHLGLTTANSMALAGGGVFDVFNTPASQAAGLTGNPLLGARNLMVDPAARSAAGIHGVPGIVADGINISVDRELLIDAVDGSVKVQDSSLALRPWHGQGGSLSLLGSEVLVEGTSQLLATGSKGGGLIQVGGSWQNSNLEVRQAVRTAFGSGALADASAIDHGNGGTVVLWSDVFNSSSFTTATGNLIAEAGRQGGDGGRLETSGYHLDLAGLRVSTMATKGKTGVWLLDPSDITITNTTPTIQGVGTNPVVFSTGGNTAEVNVVDLQNALGASNVEITTAGAGNGSGDITLASAVAVNSATTLTLKADRNIVLNANYSQSGLGWLELLAGQGQQVTGGVSGSGNVSLNGGSLVVETDTTSPSNYTGIISGANTNLVKRGVGVFSLGAENTYTGSTTVQEGGELRISAAGSIADASALTVNPTATFRLSSTGAETIGSLSGGGSVVLSTTDNILSVGAANTSTTFSGVISGLGSLVKVGSGTLTLTGANTYTGATSINNGVLHVANNAALGASSSGTTIATGAALEISGGVAIAEPLSVAGAGISLGGAVVNVSDSNQLTGLLTLAAASEIQVDAGTLTFDVAAGDAITGPHNLTFDGVGTAIVFDPIATGAGSLIKNGAGTLVLAGANTYSGGTAINGGAIGLDAALGNPQQTPPFTYRWGRVSTGLGSGAVTVNDGAELNLTGMSLANDVTLSAGVAGGSLRNGRYEDPNNFDGSYFSAALTGALTINQTTGSVIDNAASMTLSGLITGNGRLYKLGGGTLWLSNNANNAANNFQGGIIIEEGALGLLSSTALSSGPITVLNGGMLDLHGTTVATNNSLTLNGSANGLGALVNSNPADATYPGLVTLGSDSWIVGETGLINLTNPGTITGDGHTLTLGGAEGGEISSIIGTGSGGLIKTGDGTWELAGNNTYTGPTTVNAGTLTVNGSGPSSATCNNGATSNKCTPDPPVQDGGGGGGDPVDEEDVADDLDIFDEEDVADDLDIFDEEDVADDLDIFDDGDVADDLDIFDDGDVADDVDLADDEQLANLFDAFDGVFSEEEIREIDAILDSLVSESEDSPLIFSETVDFDGLSDLADAFTGGDIDGATDFSSSQAAESAISDTPDSFEGALALSDAAGETTLSTQGFVVDVSLGSSFSVEAQGDAESAESSTVGSSSEQSSASPSESATDSTGSLAGDSAEPSASSDSSSAPANTTPGGTPVANVPPQQAVVGLAQSDQAQSEALVNAVLPEQRGSAIATPSVTQMQSGLSNAAATIRSTGGAGGLGSGSRGGTGIGPAGTLGPQSWLPRGLLLSTDSDQLMASASTLIAASDVGRAALLPPSFNRAAYNPAILYVRFTQGREKLSSSSNDAFLDITLIPLEGEPEGRRVELSQVAFANDLRTLYRQLSRQESLQVDDPKSPSRRLSDQLFAAITPVLQQRKITTLLISADRGLQAVPFAALHDGDGYLGDRYAFSLTPSLALTNLSPPIAAGGRLLAVGASEFDGLAPLPLVPTELTMMSSVQMKDTALNRQFTPSTLFEMAADSRYSRVHVATHAEFLPGGPAKSKLYSGTVPIALSDFVKLRLARRDAPLDLITFSACRTALGDADSELGFAGLALQAGARSAVGTLWYVDDVATSAYFVQLYRYLEAGVPKAEALQLTRQAFVRGLVRLQGDQIVGPDGAVLTTGLTTSQQRRASGGFANPYFWAGIELLGSPW